MQDERGSRADDRAAARRRGPGVLRRGAAQDRRARDQGGPGRRPRRRARPGALPRGLPPARRARAGSEKQELRGGTGETFDWALLAQRRSKVPLILSGGLNAENVARAIAQTRPFAIDSASGTESAPGKKDEAKLRALFAAVASSASAGESGPDREAERRRSSRARLPGHPRAGTMEIPGHSRRHRHGRWGHPGARRGGRAQRGRRRVSAVEHRFGQYGGQYRARDADARAGGAGAGLGCRRARTRPTETS